MTDKHDQKEIHSYVVHYPAHGARKDDPHYKDFNHYHRAHRNTARCYIGERVGFQDCKDQKGIPALAPIDSNAEQQGLELHHAHIEFALTNGIKLSALEKDYPGVSDPDKVGAWVESGENFRWLCTYHHRAAGGAHTATHSDWEGSQYIQGLISPLSKVENE